MPRLARGLRNDGGHHFRDVDFPQALVVKHQRFRLRRKFFVVEKGFRMDAHVVGIAKPLVAVKNTRRIGKRDMKQNDALPKIDVDPETYVVRADGELLACEPATELPLAQRYFLF